jgi:hypothetical protein
LSNLFAQGYLEKNTAQKGGAQLTTGDWVDIITVDREAPEGGNCQ